MTSEGQSVCGTSVAANASACLMWILAGVICSAASVMGAPSGAWRTYEVYQPTITRHDVIDARTHANKYNHCPTIAWFDGRWFCMWGSNTRPAEHDPGQRIFFSTSQDGRSWAPAEVLFSNAEHSENPVQYPADKGHQWQPNLAQVDGELWAFWNQGGSAQHFKKGTADLRGLYFSRLNNAGGKWVNRRLEWGGSMWPRFEGRTYFIASTQNPYRLRTGRVLAPVTLYATAEPARDAPPQAVDWWGSEKRNSVIYTDDGGKTWALSPGCAMPGFSWIQWEPTIWESPNGDVLMFARNNTHWGLGHGKPTSGEYLLWSISKNGGETWSPHQFVPLESICSRMHVVPSDGRGVWEAVRPDDDFEGRRYMMVHNDAPGALYSWAVARRNLALFFTRGGGIDFVAGNTLTGDEPEVAYPQAWGHDDALAICYTQGNSAPRSIRVAMVSPLPKHDKYYIFPRANDLAAGARPRRLADAWSFDRHQHMATSQPVEPKDEGFAFGAWLQPRAPGALFDTRKDASAPGFVIILKGAPANPAAGKDRSVVPTVTLLGPQEEVVSSLPMSISGEWQYMGITLDNRSGAVLFCVNGARETVRLKSPVHRSLKGINAHIGGKRPPKSQLAGYAGELRFLALYDGAAIGERQHDSLRDHFARGTADVWQGSASGMRPIVWMDAALRDAFERDFVLPPPEGRGGTEAVTFEGVGALRFRDHGSAGIDLDDNERARGDKVAIDFQFLIESGDSQTLCTVGDFNEPARVIARDGQVVLMAKGMEAPCGPVNANGWTSVSLETWRDRTTARLGSGPSAGVRHRPVATWAYLGEAFPKYGEYRGTRFLVDIGSLRTRVERATP